MTPSVDDNPIPQNLECATERARQLLRQVLPEASWREFQNSGIIDLTGDRGQYIISAHAQTEIRSKVSGRCVAYACLQLSIPAPNYDRMVAEYLLLRNAENAYWKTANVFYRSQMDFGVATILLLAFDFTLFVHLLLEVWPT